LRAGISTETFSVTTGGSVGGAAIRVLFAMTLRAVRAAKAEPTATGTAEARKSTPRH
jgi:hypothetical protein